MHRSFHFAACLLGLLLFGAPTGLVAQEPPSPGAPESIAAPAAQERIIYVPFQNLDGAFEKPDANVILPYAEYQKLLKSWKDAQAGVAGPGAVISAASYTVRIEEGAARITAALKVQVLARGWTEVPLKYGDAAVGSLKSKDNVLLRGVGTGQYSLMFPDAGNYDVELELATAVHQSPDGNTFSFDCPSVALTTVDVTVPQAAQTVEIQPVVVSSPVPDAGANVTRIKANVGSAGKILIRWRPEASLQPEMNLLASVTSQMLITLGDGLTHTDAWLNYEILRGELDSVRIAVPKAHRVLDVDAAGRVRNWKVEEARDSQILTLELLSPVKDKLTVEVHTEAALGEGPIDLAGLDAGGTARGIHALDVVRETGQIAVRNSADLTLAVTEQQQVVRIEPADVSPRLAGNNSLIFKYYSPAITLRVSAAPVTPRLQVQHSAQLVFRDEELQLTHELAYTIERSGVFELTARVPENVVIDDVQGSAVKDYRVDAATGILMISLRERTMQAVQLTVKGHLPLPAPGQTFNLPLLEPLNVEREAGNLMVFARESLEVRTDAAGVGAAQPQAINRGVRLGDAALASAWTFTRRPVVIPVRTERKPTRLSARIGTTVNVQPELTAVQTRVDFLVEYAGVDTFRIEVPDSISSLLRIEAVPGDEASAPIKQKTPAASVNGKVVWTIITQREALGRQQFLVSYDLPPPAPPAAGTTAAEVTAQVPIARPLGLTDAAGANLPLSQLQGEITFRKDQSLALQTSPVGTGLEQIDVRELTLLPHDGLLAYRYFRDEGDAPLAVTVTQNRFEIQEVVATVVPRGLVEVVIGEDNTATYRCRLQVKTTERQRLLAYLPVNLEVLGAFVGDREIRLEKAEVNSRTNFGENFSAFWVNVARAGSSETPFNITFQFLWTVNPALRDSSAMRGELEFPLPVLGERGAGVVQELKVVLWTPDRYTLLGNPEGFEWEGGRNWDPLGPGVPSPADAAGLDQWIAGEGVALAPPTSLPTAGRVPFVYSNLGGSPRIAVVWWRRLPMTLIFSIALLLIGWILLKTPWENKVSFLILLAFAATMYGLYDHGALLVAVWALRWGLGALLLLWLVHGLGRRFRGVAPVSAKPQPQPAPPAPQPV